MYIPCVFQTKHKGLSDNARLALLGDSPVLGEWTPRRAVLAEPVGENDLYEVVVMLQVNSICHFKWCIIDKSSHILYWENHKQRVFRVEDTLMYIQAPWDKDCDVMAIKNPDLSSIITKQKMVLYTFQMNLPNGIKKHHQLYLLGNDRALGAWVVHCARVAQCSKTNGRVTACLPVGAEVEFKWMLKCDDGGEGIEVWEDGPNRSCKIEDNTMTVIECDWGDVEESFWICKHLGLRPTEFLPLVHGKSPSDLFADIHKVGVFKPGIQYFLCAGFTVVVSCGIIYGLYKGAIALKIVKS